MTDAWSGVDGTSTAIVRLTGDDRHERLCVLNYSRNGSQQGVRVRLLGRLQPASFVGGGGTAANAALLDVEHPTNTTEFTLPTFSTIAIVDLSRP